MRTASLILTAFFLGGGASAAPPPEPVEARLEAVDPASREIVVHGVTWALSSTVAIQMPGNPRASLRDVTAGMNVRLEVEPGDVEVPRVRSITVLPD